MKKTESFGRVVWKNNNRIQRQAFLSRGKTHHRNRREIIPKEKQSLNKKRTVEKTGNRRLQTTLNQVAKK